MLSDQTRLNLNLLNLNFDFHSSSLSASFTFVTFSLILSSSVALAQAAPSVIEQRSSDNPLNINWGPAPPPDKGPPISANALRDPAYLPAQIGGIVGAYALSLVLVAITLLALSKKRREHLTAGNDEIDFETYEEFIAHEFHKGVLSREDLGNDAVPNFSYPSPTRSEFNGPHFVHHSPVSSVGAPGVDPLVDQRIVAADRIMAQQQLEDMYKYVMEHEDAKQRGIVLEAPVIPGSNSSARPSTSDRSTHTVLSKKERIKPANLNLSATREEKSQSRTSSLLSALRSPKKKSIKGVSISSPIMTPQSGTFPRHESQELSSIPPRHYAPPPPPPIPTDLIPPVSARVKNNGAPLTPDMSPESVQSIDERLGLQLSQGHYNRNYSTATTEADPESATSEHSQVPLVGLPASPRGGRFPSLPASPKPGATFQRPNAPSAVRTNGALPLRAYEPALSSPSAVAHTTKQTVFERKGPLSPLSARTPGTAGTVPYSPYQPFTPCMPITPSLVTKEDRRRMKKMVPKTPTLEMVRSSEDIW